MTFVDGTGAPSRVADVGVKDGLIVAIGALNGDADRVIDAVGLYVTPGFIDQHTHYDAQVFWDPYCSNSGEHGTTTTVMTNCGFGLPPCRPADRERVMLMLENTEEISSLHMRTNLPWDWDVGRSAPHDGGPPQGPEHDLLRAHEPVDGVCVGADSSLVRGVKPGSMVLVFRHSRLGSLRCRGELRSRS